MRFAVIAVVATCLPALAGCASFWNRPHVVKASPQNPAAEIVGLWQPAKGPGPNGLPSRGMAGRLMFFTRGNAAPVLVDGDVRIYLFDNDGPPEQQARPIHQFDFRAEDWPNFLQSSTLGPTYNLFIPYTRGGHKQVECTVQVRFTPKNGATVFSDMTTLTLPGSVDGDKGEPGDVAAAGESQPKSKLAVHTIPQPRASRDLKRLTPPTPPTSSAASGLALASRATPGERGAIQQMSHEEEAASEPASAARIAALEETVRRLEAERTSSRPPPPRRLDIAPDDFEPQVSRSPIAPAVHESAATDDEEMPARSRRFRLGSTSASTD